MTRPHPLHRMFLASTLLMAVLLLSACGNKGDLVLPPPSGAAGQP